MEVGIGSAPIVSRIGAERGERERERAKEEREGLDELASFLFV